MTRSYPPLPPREDLLAIFRAALANAEDLLSDAQLLLDSGRLARALALATLSWEELSKGQLCLLVIVLPEITAEEFWERFRDHEGKLGRVHAFAAFMQAEPVGPVAEYVKKVMSQAKSSDKQKLRGLYVDYRRGKILLPGQISERVARRQIKVVREALDMANTVFSVDSLEEMFTQTTALLGGLKNAVVADPEAMAAAMQEAVRGQCHIEERSGSARLAVAGAWKAACVGYKP